MTPAQRQLQIDVLFNAGIEAMRTVGEPGDHGVTVAGMQGCGVSTPRAAELTSARYWDRRGGESYRADAGQKEAETN
jgi:hypothetical protein